MAKLTLAALFAALLAAGSPAWAETYTLETYYPSPVGVYKWIKADFQDFNGYAGNLNAGGSPPTVAMPAPGRLFYNRDLNGFYYSSSAADPNDSSTWYKSISGLDQEIIGQGTKAAFTPAGSGSIWVTALTPVIGAVAGTNGKILRSPKRYTSPGLATVGISGTFCVGPLTAYAKPTVVEGSGPDPQFTLYYRRFTCATAACSTVGSWGDWISLGSSKETLTLDASGCGTFEMEAVVMARAMRGLAMGFRIKRDAAGDRIENVSLQMKRVISF